MCVFYLGRKHIWIYLVQSVVECSKGQTRARGDLKSSLQWARACAMWGAGLGEEEVFSGVAGEDWQAPSVGSFVLCEVGDELFLLSMNQEGEGRGGVNREEHQDLKLSFQRVEEGNWLESMEHPGEAGHQESVVLSVCLVVCLQEHSQSGSWNRKYFAGFTRAWGSAVIADGEQCRICDLRRRFNFRTRDQAWSLKSFCIAVLLQYERARENFRHRHQKGGGECPLC